MGKWMGNNLRRFFIGSILVCLCFAAACQADAQGDDFVRTLSETTTPIPTQAIQTPIRTRKLTFTASSTLTPTITLTLTPYPSFDARSIVRNTPAAPARCPKVDPHYTFDPYLPPNAEGFDFYGYLETIEVPILKILNAGASPSLVAESYNSALESRRLNLWDLTGDGVPEMVIYKEMLTAVLGCREGRFQELLNFSFGTMFSPQIFAIVDMNGNFTPDVVFATIIGSGWNLGVMILEWNGSEFISMLQADHSLIREGGGGKASSTSRLARILFWYEQFFAPLDIALMNGMAEWEIRDLDGNGTKELILKDFGPAHMDTLYSFGPWRGKRVVFSWDGLHYLYSALEMDPPKYRFQAVQDADRFFLMGDYARAKQYYRAVIADVRLDWWTPDRVRYLLDQQWAVGSGRPTPVPPMEDADEYPCLAAYASYRLMVLDSIRGDLESAEKAYAGLLKSHPYGSPGYPYVLVAAGFLGTYRATGDVAKACARVLEYVESHEDILAPLGDSNHGGQSHNYESQDLCPYP
jgi:hypothetical protein